MIKEFDRKLVLEDGTEISGYSFGADCEKVCEIVFNTSMVGYQEILSDPSYTYQAVVMTYPLIGNYGMADDDYETDIPTLGAFIVSEINNEPSNFRSTATLDSIMKKFGIPGVSGVDTRKLTRYIRNNGMCKVLICDINTPHSDCLEKLSKTQIARDAVSKVTAPAVVKKECSKPQFHIAAIDCGMKHNIIRSFNARGCSVTVVPFNTKAEDIAKLSPDGIFISNGPGDPQDVPELIDTIKSLHGKYPMFGICLGHQIISLSYGAKCYKLKFGHRGGNHPVKNLDTGKIEITSQNHSYAVDINSIKDTPLKVTHINLLDNTIEGVENKEDKVFSVQYHPESAPGPEDSRYLFDKFIKMMEENKNA
jgi:carbamoyl-phosphate synthase small subunit